MEEYLRQLIAMPTTTGDHEHNNKALDFIESFCVAHGLHVKRFIFNGFGSLVATTVKDSKTPKVMLTGHLDVVPANADQFELREEAGKWYGRGVYDMKFAVAAYMAIIDQLAASKTLHQHDIGLLLTTDEETSGRDGVLRLVEMGYKPDICVLPDGGQDWNIETLAKGLSYGRFYATGKAAHGSRPWEGESAIFNLLGAITELRALFADQKLNTSTLNIGMIQGGEAINQIPASAHATLDIRYISDSSRQQLYPQIMDIFERHNIRYEEYFYDLPCVTDLEHPLVKPFLKSVEKVVGVQPTGTTSFGGSDARHLAKGNIPAILTHPYGGAQHSADEWIDKAGALQFQDVLLDYLAKTAQ